LNSKKQHHNYTK